MPNLSEANLIYVTAGSVPHNKSLVSSQVIPMLSTLHEKKIFKNVKLFSFIPLVAVLSKLRGVAVQECFENISFDYEQCYSCIWESSKLVYLFRMLLVKLAARKLSQYVLKMDGHALTLLHCRGYYATHIACEVQKSLPDLDIKVLFDMRSILSNEYVLRWKLFGKLSYTSILNWEAKLLSTVDKSLLTVHRGIRTLQLQGIASNIGFVPIQGFSNKTEFTKSIFAKRWDEKRITYVGSISSYYSPESIYAIFNELERVLEEANISICTQYNKATVLNRWACKSIAFKDIRQIYDQSLATVITVKSSSDTFMKYKESCNFFSTKAAESLSVGVPIIVNENIRELAEYVRTNHCGVVFRELAGGKISFVDVQVSELISRKFWLTLTKNTYQAGKIFRRDNVINKYLGIYNSLVNEAGNNIESDK